MTDGSSRQPILDPTSQIPYEATQGPPIFVVGNGRSGTTLMEMMMSAHPNIYVCHELAYYAWFTGALRTRSVSDLLDPYFSTVNFRWLRLHPRTVTERLPDSLPRPEAWKLFEVMMRLKSASLGKVRYGDKSPPHIWYLRSIFRDFPDARVIVMVRDPRGEAASVSNMPWGCAKDLPNCLINELTRKAVLRQTEEMLVVRLEDLQADPRAQMERVLEFVGEPWDEAVLDHPNHDPDPGRLPDVPWFSSSEAPVQQQEPAWRRLSPERIALIEWLCRKSMKLHGYEPADVPKLGMFGKARLILGSIPETVRYAVAYVRLGAYFAKPNRWDWYDEGGRERTRGLNPAYWERNPNFVYPEAPEVPEPAQDAEDAGELA